jgi:hypothetical protein
LSQKSLLDANLWQLFLTFDEDLMRGVVERGCPCGGPLHRSDYARKPRGPGLPLDPRFSTRFSACCGVEGCRQRATPPSVRFLGRKVFVGVVVVLVSALRQGATPTRMRVLHGEFGVDAQTVQRWSRWWRETVVQSRCFRLIRSRLVGLGNDVPRSVMDYVGGWDGIEQLRTVMHLFAPFGQSAGLPDHAW